jgi:peptidoglycan/xylan/chitin deacetylase (PgdA/CDA1 family)
MSAQPEKGIFLLSLDTELAWGTRGNKAYVKDYEKTREVILRLLRLLEKYEIRATWAVVGHLFLDQCSVKDGMKHPEIEDVPSHWFDIDPCTDLDHDPMWYGSDIIKQIQNCRVPQEIGSHTFSHMVADECSGRCFVSELRAARRLAEKEGIELKSLVFPKNHVAFTSELAKEGFTSFRGSDENWYARFSGAWKKIAHMIDNYFVIPSPSIFPRKEKRVWNIPGSYFYVHARGWAKWLPVSFRVRKTLAGIDRAVKERRMFHLWFHPFNISSNPDGLLEGLERIFSRIALLRASGQLENWTMQETAEQMERLSTHV